MTNSNATRQPIPVVTSADLVARLRVLRAVEGDALAHGRELPAIETLELEGFRAAVPGARAVVYRLARTVDGALWLAGTFGKKTRLLVPAAHLAAYNL